MKNGRLLFEGPEAQKFLRSWYRLTGRRDIVGKRDRDKMLESILSIHETIEKRCESHEEKFFCHTDVYGRYLRFCSEDFDRISESRHIDHSSKFDRLLGWCNKPERVNRFVVNCLACYEKNDDVPSINPPSKSYESVYVNDKEYHFLLEDQFGKYYFNDDNFDIMVVEHGGQHTTGMRFNDFRKKPRPKAHNVGMKYLFRRLNTIEEPTSHQHRFLREFEKRDNKNNLFPRQSGGSKEKDSRKLPKVRWSGADNRQKSKTKVGKTNR